ncbi:protein kinase [Nocardia asteroides]|uniref:protein kinase domain-containing protein n=1 Tax=Nocardia asteroides TaxID=1824 RepID=UPI0037C5A2BF
MAETDPLRTQRDVAVAIPAELDASGFADPEEIGRGGFGVVYRCTEVALDRTVAVKVLTTELDEENLARFFREQKAMGRLTGHPNIVTVLEVGATATGRPFLVMPYHPLQSLDAQIHRDGPLGVEAVLWIGVKIAGALESAHRLGIVHRDVKPGNILLTDYGEPALIDFGIARVTGGYRTTSGALTGSPAFVAPEVLEGEAPTAAADVYGLGATLFCALTGHAAFERRSGENVVSQFLRVTKEPVPDLRDSGIAEDVAAAVATAMSRDPRDRQSPVELGSTLAQIQRHHGFRVDEMALGAGYIAERRSWHRLRPSGSRPRPTAEAGRDDGGSLSLELTSFVDRRAEVVEVKNLLGSSQLVTLTGIGGVGKTRLALRVARIVRRDFVDGVRLVELADVSNVSHLIDVVAVAVGVRDASARPLAEAVSDYLASKRVLLVLDNCEQLVVPVAELVESWLRVCPELRVLATSREPLDIPGEEVVRVSPLAVPDVDRASTPRVLPRYDAVTLFADRAGSVVPNFELTDENKATVARICERLDGLPLAIELAAARMRTLSPEQILQRLDDRYSLLTRSSRTAPERQQTLQWCIDWSFDLCTPAEQRLWARLSVFTGGFDLDSAERVCGTDLAPQTTLDVMSALVDKSVVLREDTRAGVRFRMFDTVRAYGRLKLDESGELPTLRRRHRDWFLQVVLDAESTWISDRQLDWLARLERELPNLRDALTYCLSGAEESAAGLQITAGLFPFWTSRGLCSEGRQWIERLRRYPGEGTVAVRVKALQTAALMAMVQGDLRAAVGLLGEATALAEQEPDDWNTALLDWAGGTLATFAGDYAQACESLESAVQSFAADRQSFQHILALIVLGWAHMLRGEPARATDHFRQVVSITEQSGESSFRAIALCGSGIAAWQQDARVAASQLLESALRLDRGIHSPTISALCLEARGWSFGQEDTARAVVLMGAADGVWRSLGSLPGVLPALAAFHEDAVRAARNLLGDRAFEAAFAKGQGMEPRDAVAYALGEQLSESSSDSGTTPPLTKREQQVAALVAQGLTNKQIATKLVISPRTAQGHVEHILTKLGFSSRAQIAAWLVEEAGPAL